ncbi:MAG TPA: hypothetical protein P5543_10030 [Planctomycetota bacterium]|nr:hypothetical protein [Planctomycetota bacterium]
MRISCTSIYICIVLLCVACNDSEMKMAKVPGIDNVFPKNIVETTENVENIEEVVQKVPEWLHKSYAVKVFFACWDTPNHKVETEVWKQQWKHLISQESLKSIEVDFVEDMENTEKILYAKDIRKDLGGKFFKDLEYYEMAVAISFSYLDKQVQMRRLHLKTGRFSPYVSFVFQEDYDAVFQQFLTILSLEGWIQNVQEHSTNVIFRTFPRTLQMIGKDDYFYLYSGNQRWAGTLVKIAQPLFSENDSLFHAKGTCLGLYMPQPFLRLEKVYFSEGNQTFRIVDEDDSPQLGFSIFASYDSFSMKMDKFITTTDATGEFTLSNHKKAPIFLVIAKNIENVLLPFHRRVVVISNEKNEVENIQIIKWDSMFTDTNYTRQIKGKQRVQEIKNQIFLFFEQAQDYLENRELDKAKLCIQMTRKCIEQLDSQEFKSMEQSLHKMESLYSQAIRKRELSEQYANAMKQIEKVDEAVKSMSYTKAASLLRIIAMNWPASDYDKEKQEEVIVRENAIRKLQKEWQQPIGKARKFFQMELPRLTVSITYIFCVDVLTPHLETFIKFGDFDENNIYNDIDLFLQCKIALNNIAQKLAEKEEGYTKTFDNATLEERQKIFHKQEQMTKIRSYIDGLLKNFSNNE